MNNTIDYVIRYLKITEDNIEAIVKVLKSQYKFNRNVVAFSVLTTAGLWILLKEIRNNQKEIENLKKCIAKLEFKTLEEELTRFASKEGE